jgi:hypothetical protein
MQTPIEVHLLPARLPIAQAAAIAGLSSQTFRERCIETRAVATEDGKVVLSSLAKHLGRLIEPVDLLRAQRRRDRANDWQRQYRRSH